MIWWIHLLRARPGTSTGDNQRINYWRILANYYPVIGPGDRTKGENEIFPRTSRLSWTLDMASGARSAAPGQITSPLLLWKPLSASPAEPIVSHTLTPYASKFRSARQSFEVVRSSCLPQIRQVLDLPPLVRCQCQDVEFLSGTLQGGRSNAACFLSALGLGLPQFASRFGLRCAVFGRCK